MNQDKTKGHLAGLEDPKDTSSTSDKFTDPVTTNKIISLNHLGTDDHLEKDDKASTNMRVVRNHVESIKGEKHIGDVKGKVNKHQQ